MKICVNGRFVDPLRIKMPSRRSLDGQLMDELEKERDRLSTAMKKYSRRPAPRIPTPWDRVGMPQESRLRTQ